MPTYEYQCNECGHHFELFQPITDSPVKSCPVCQGKVRRLISGGSGLIFKGSGFYITDYKKKTETTDTRRVRRPEQAEPKKTTAKSSKATKKTED
ncbi:MAG: zinc ribbon domain-containing protein [candidate division WOR-3 bacterium]|nr:zinc ribbon domain-containing protein [candidate division WOR-3 bacterium]MDH5683125.1 zinc ribbon domain-containing protein [candidate division WOR-3 bacterium]